LYPALHRLERRGWIAAKWGTSENNRKAKFYELTAAGRKQLEEETEAWEKLTEVVGRCCRQLEPSCVGVMWRWVSERTSIRGCGVMLVAGFGERLCTIEHSWCETFWWVAGSDVKFAPTGSRVLSVRSGCEGDVAAQRAEEVEVGGGA
jgi:hypothetical protein